MHKSLIAICILAITIVLLQFGGQFTPLDRALENPRFKLNSRAPTGETVLVEIDSKSLAAIGSWPWPRKTYADIITQITALQAEQIAFDIDFSLPSDPTNDALLAQSLQHAGGGVALAAFQQLSTSKGAKIHTNKPMPLLRNDSWMVLANIFPDSDGIARTIPFGARVNGENIPSIAALLSGVMQSDVQGNAFEFAVDFSIDVTAIPRISAIDLLQGKISSPALKDKIVLIGAQAIELRDTLSVPAYGIIGGPELHALGVETLLQNRQISHLGSKFSSLTLLLLTLLAWTIHTRLSFTRTIIIALSLPLAIEASAIALLHFAPVSLPTGQIHTFVLASALLRLLTELRKRNWKLFAARAAHQNIREIFEQVISENFDGIIVLDNQNRIIVANRAAKRMLTRKPNEKIIGKHIDVILPPKIVDATHAARNLNSTARQRQNLSRGEFLIEGSKKSKKNTPNRPRLIDYVATASKLSATPATSTSTRKSAISPEATDELIVCLTLRDITRQRATQEKINYLANFDTQTGAANRTHFQQHIDRQFSGQSQAKSIAVLFFGIEKFETFVTALGFDTSDKLLVSIVERAKNFHPDIISIARFENAGFALLVNNIDSFEQACRCARALSNSLAQPFLIEKNRSQIIASIGVAGSWQGSASTDNLTQRASWALAHAIKKGGNCIQFYDAKAEETSARLQQIDQALRPALENGEFELVYQPQFCLETWKMIGVEALVRWHSPTLGRIFPDEFISVAEANGVIDQLGEWILKTACRDALNWPEAISVAVNVSPEQFTRGNLCTIVDDALRQTGFPPNRLELEITESTFLNSSGKNIETMNALHAKGIRFALDDFGTGYSSLTHFAELPLSKVKIDQAFVRTMLTSNQTEAIINSVIVLARGLGIKTIAEGIEELAHANKLRQMGCQSGQGYLYSKPLRAALIDKLTANSAIIGKFSPSSTRAA